jgi:hypothetical protein
MSKFSVTTTCPDGTTVKEYDGIWAQRISVGHTEKIATTSAFGKSCTIDVHKISAVEPNLKLKILAIASTAL